MSYFRFCVFCISCISSCLFGAEEKDEISVVLGSEHALLPMHIESVENDGSTLPAEYLPNIRAITSFDMNNNGMTRTLEGKERERIQNALGAHSYDGIIDLEKLKEHGASYLIRWKVHEKTLDVKVALVTSGMVRTISPVILSGDPSKDVGKIHQLSDCIYSILFGKQGIAHTKIVYTVKKRVSSSQKEPQYLSEVIEADYDGHNARAITNTHSLCVTPLWVPTRTPGVVQGEKSSKSHSVLYVSYELGQPKIFGRSLRDGRIYRATLMRGNQLTPAISTDGSMIAFCSDISGTADLYVADFEAGVGTVSKPRQVFHSRGSATACPTFSPDKKKIAF
jgi:TolB protein